ncbi:alpha-hydroxy acid oxidase [Sphingomonas sp. KR1UV-12]|uniref:Alpha-hydroxy acid oxidase n=1 Tax=Sphingomonas aurea TaxID=3063994 RepID=A0ABT9EIS9_9SPHN|nr:alpha-hydroxy acid oxidase [Sphingomonas sp. KR1UV-12]MDP1026856.1 alpha-hydroxy acid oxidase [Sphingomonas sp. KR1UV-12]
MLARRRLPRPIFDYIDGGADDEVSLRRNAGAFTDYELVPDVLNDVSETRTEIEMFGQCTRWPLMLAPTGLTRMFHGQAELAVAHAAARHGLLYSLSTMGTTRLEDLAQAFAGPKVFQIYIFKDRGLTAEFVARCREAGFHGLALTVDTPVAGNRERDRVSGLSLPPKLTLKSLFSFAVHPSWSLPALTGSKFDLANVSHKVDALASGPMSLFDYIGGQFDRSVGWRDVEWLAREWNGPLAIKGVMTPEDARRSIASGATDLQSRRAPTGWCACPGRSDCGGTRCGGRCARRDLRRRHSARLRRGEGVGTRRNRLLDRTPLPIWPGSGR